MVITILFSLTLESVITCDHPSDPLNNLYTTAAIVVEWHIGPKAPISDWLYANVRGGHAGIVHSYGIKQLHPTPNGYTMPTIMMAGWQFMKSIWQILRKPALPDPT